MAYVGNPIDTQNTFQSLQGKRFNGDGSTTDFTLDVAPGNVLDIEVFVGNVRQDPNSAYTLSGTTLTFTGAPPSGTYNIYVVHQAKSVGTIDVPASGVQAGSLASSVLTGQTDIGADIADADLFLVDDGAGGTLRKTAASRIKTYAGFSVSDITGATELAATPADTDELIISDAGTLKRIDYSYLKSENSPYWFARKTDLSDQTLTRATKTKVTGMSADEADSHSAYSSNRFTVPSGHGGIYLVTGSIHGVSSNAGGDGEEFNVYVYKNGTEKRTSGFTFDPGGKFNQVYLNLVGLIELAAGDYVELYAELTDDDNSNTCHINGGLGTHFGGFKIA